MTREEITREAWGQWQAELNRGLQGVTAFLYAHLICGARRVLIDSVEPCTRIADSIQLELIEYIYQEILRTEYDWVARTLFQGQWLDVADRVSRNAYNHDAVATMILQTSNEVLLEDLIARPLPPGDLAANANTIILLGRLSGEEKTGRGAFVLKHRGQKCSEAIVPFEITGRVEGDLTATLGCSTMYTGLEIISLTPALSQREREPRLPSLEVEDAPQA